MSNDMRSEFKSKKYAGFYPRMLAHNIDLIILLPLCYLIGYYIENNMTLFSLCGMLYIIYHSLFEASQWHGTPGKKMQKISVESATDEKPITLVSSFLRNISKVLSLALLFSGFIMVAFDDKSRGLHDRLAGTVVVFAEKLN